MGDTYLRGRLTATAGLRIDKQTGHSRPSSVAANPVFPDLLAPLTFSGRGQGVRWTDLSPRLASAYALDSGRRTLLRVSWARYAGQLGAVDAAFDNPNVALSFLAYPWDDLNGDGLAQPGEVRVSDGILFASAVDPNNPSSADVIDAEYSARHDEEWIAGLEREVFRGLSLSAAYTHRRALDRAWAPRLGLTAGDYQPRPAVTSNGYTGQAFAPSAVAGHGSGGGRVLTNRPEFSLAYDGLELAVVKPMSHHWMARLAASYMSWREDLDGPAAVQNPTRTTALCQGLGCRFAGPRVDGGQASGAVNAKWQMAANALIELPRGFEISGALLARQGMPRPVFLFLNAGADGRLSVLADPELDTRRFDDVWMLDLRGAKAIALAGRSRAHLTVDVFNALNSNVVLARTRAATSSVFGRIDEIVNPRIVRLGLRVSF